MRTKQTFEALNALTARFEELVQQQPKPTLSAAHLGRISEKFSGKSLKELTEIVGKMPSLSKPSCQE